MIGPRARSERPAPNRRGGKRTVSPAQAAIRIAVLDDYQNVALSMADWSARQ
jgi:hypothetical protein